MRDPGGEFIGLVFIVFIGGVEGESECDVCADMWVGGVWGVGDGVKDGVRGVKNEGLRCVEGGVRFVVCDVKTVDARGAGAIKAEGDLRVSVLSNLPKPVFVCELTPGLVCSFFQFVVVTKVGGIMPPFHKVKVPPHY